MHICSAAVKALAAAMTFFPHGKKYRSLVGDIVVVDGHVLMEPDEEPLVLYHPYGRRSMKLVCTELHFLINFIAMEPSEPEVAAIA